MPNMMERKCICGKKFMARTVDVKRGWGKSCSKSCAATRTNRKTGNYQRYIGKRNNYRNSGVNKETFMHYANESGGIPEFDRHGEWIGSTHINGSDDHDCNKDEF